MGRHAPDHTEAACSAAVEALERAFGDRLVAVALFGSSARGTAGPSSDLDLLVVARGLPADPFSRCAVFARTGATLTPDGRRIDLVGRTPEEFLADIAPLHLDLALDARILHDEDEWLAGRLARVRQRLQEAGLERGPDLVWRWRRLPRAADWAITWDGVRV